MGLDLEGQTEVVGLGPERPEQPAIEDHAGAAEHAGQENRPEQARQMEAPIEKADHGPRQQYQGEQPGETAKGDDHPQTAAESGQANLQRIGLLASRHRKSLQGGQRSGLRGIPL